MRHEKFVKNNYRILEVDTWQPTNKLCLFGYTNY